MLQMLLQLPHAPCRILPPLNLRRLDVQVKRQPSVSVILSVLQERHSARVILLKVGFHDIKSSMSFTFKPPGVEAVATNCKSLQALKALKCLGASRKI